MNNNEKTNNNTAQEPVVVSNDTPDYEKIASMLFSSDDDIERCQEPLYRLRNNPQALAELFKGSGMYLVTPMDMLHLEDAIREECSSPLYAANARIAELEAFIQNNSHYQSSNYSTSNTLLEAYHKQFTFANRKADND